jgi:hypothetical protein
MVRLNLISRKSNRSGNNNQLRLQIPQTTHVVTKPVSQWHKLFVQFLGSWRYDRRELVPGEFAAMSP